MKKWLRRLLGTLLGLPLVLSWPVVQGPLLALASGKGVLRTLWQRLPHALIATNLGLAGINALAAPLISAEMPVPEPPPVTATATEGLTSL